MSLDNTQQIASSCLDLSELGGYVESMNSSQPPAAVRENHDDCLAQWLSSVAVCRDKKAFGYLFDHLAPKVKGFLRKNGTPEDSLDDLTQEVMFKLWRYAGHFDQRKGKVTTWVFTIARNARIDLIRKEKRPEPDINDPALVKEYPRGSDDILLSKQNSTRISEAIDELPDEQQEILKYAFYEEKSHAEIAMQTGLPLGTVKSRIRLAFQRLKKTLTELDI
ncbi:MAG: sigma-70 family RNA polymerase sigma factor [Pseudomonadota bacterium]|nr:sigma-70 family RNA polymerase sigma factor [Pseudomonadota bacterium]